MDLMRHARFSCSGSSAWAIIVLLEAFGPVGFQIHSSGKFQLLSSSMNRFDII